MMQVNTTDKEPCPTGLSALVYISHARGDIDINLLQEIALTSLMNNERDGLTGTLFYSEQMFFQYLEGPDEKLACCAQKISQDKRHEAFTLLWSDSIDMPIFPNWSLALFHPSNSEFLELISQRWWQDIYPTVNRLKVPIGVGLIRHLCSKNFNLCEQPSRLDLPS